MDKTDQGLEYHYLDPLVKQQRQYWIAVIVIGAILVVASIAAAIFLNRPQKLDNPQQLIDKVETIIRSQIDSRSDLQFDDLKVERRENMYLVTGSVDAIAITGDTGRFKFSCEVRRQTD